MPRKSKPTIPISPALAAVRKANAERAEQAKRELQVWPVRVAMHDPVSVASQAGGDPSGRRKLAEKIIAIVAALDDAGLDEVLSLLTASPAEPYQQYANEIYRAARGGDVAGIDTMLADGVEDQQAVQCGVQNQISDILTRYTLTGELRPNFWAKSNVVAKSEWPFPKVTSEHPKAKKLLEYLWDNGRMPDREISEAMQLVGHKENQIDTFKKLKARLVDLVCGDGFDVEMPLQTQQIIRLVRL